MLYGDCQSILRNVQLLVGYEYKLPRPHGYNPVRKEVQIMKYYKVKQKYGQTAIWNDRCRQIGFLIGGEIYTPAEYAKLNVVGKAHCFEEIEWSRKRTYWCFGARFQITD